MKALCKKPYSRVKLSGNKTLNFRKQATVILNHIKRSKTRAQSCSTDSSWTATLNHRLVRHFSTRHRSQPVDLSGRREAGIRRASCQRRKRCHPCMFELGEQEFRDASLTYRQSKVYYPSSFQRLKSQLSGTAKDATVAPTITTSSVI